VLFLLSVFFLFGDKSLEKMFFFSFMRSGWFFTLTGVLMVVEIIGDIVPMHDHVLHAVLLFLCPVAAVFVSCPAHATHTTRVLLASLGVVLALSVHLTRAAARVLMTSTTNGVGNVASSLVESITSVVIVLLVLTYKAVSIGVLVVLLVLLLCVLVFVCWNFSGMRRSPIVPPTGEGVLQPQDTYEGWGVGGGFGGGHYTEPAAPAVSAGPLAEQALYYRMTEPLAPA